QAPQAPSGGIDAAAIRKAWPDLLAAIRKISRSTEAMLTNATVQSVEGSLVVLAHTAEPLARRLSESRNADFIAAALHEVLGGSWQVRCVHGGGGGGGSARPAGPGPRPQPSSPSREAPAQPQRTYQRPTQSTQSTQSTQPTQSAQPAQPAPSAQPARRQQPSEPDIPLPPEPDDEESMLAESDVMDLPPEVETDPEIIAHRLLAEHLGARPLD
ncbi:DNA polymerase III subunit gamma/tau, partial [Amycolatopsis rhizosphaerae]